MQIEKNITFNLTITTQELGVVKQGLLAYINALKPDDYLGSDPSRVAKDLIGAIEREGANPNPAF